MENKSNTIKDKLQSQSGSGKNKKLIIKKKVGISSSNSSQPPKKDLNQLIQDEKRKQVEIIEKDRSQKAKQSTLTAAGTSSSHKQHSVIENNSNRFSTQKDATVKSREESKSNFQNIYSNFSKDDSSIIISKMSQQQVDTTSSSQARKKTDGYQKGADQNKNERVELVKSGETGANIGSAIKKKEHVKTKAEEAFDREENEKFFKQNFKKHKNVQLTQSIPKEISILENIQVGEFAKKMNIKPSEIISKLMKMGIMATINNIIDHETASLVAVEYNCKVNIVSLYDETLIEEKVDNKEDYITRPPVVTIMGHVDHGKTKLLDTIRESSVITSESGGITQHIGAYQVKTGHGIITFLDTPGHEAFTAMRARGTSITDIVILVVAADDSVMPQTIEAINHAKDAKVPIIVAINKVDLPTANVEKVKTDLSNFGLQSEEWGGDTMICEISAKEKIGIDKLLDLILLQSEVLELKANPKRLAKGTIVEAKLDPGRGSVATVLIQNGTLNLGDSVVAGVFSGKIRAMYNDHGQRITTAGPSFPVQVTGLDGVPDAGAPFDTVQDDKVARTISISRKEYERLGQSKSNKLVVTLDNMNEYIQRGELKELKVIIKADVRGSTEAIREAIEKLSNNEVKVTTIHTGTGSIIDADVMLASASNAIIVGFHVKPTSKTSALAEVEKVQIKYYDIIYEIVDDIKNALEGMLEPEKIVEELGKAEIRNIFKISKTGNIAGCIVTEGKINKSSLIRIKRAGEIIFEGKLGSLKRVKDDVNEVATGFECGIMIENFDKIEVGDIIEAYKVESKKRKLNS